MAKLQEDKTVDYLESRYMFERRRKIYVANEEINQVWDEDDIPEFINLWKAGTDSEELKEYFGMDEWEFALLVADLLFKGKINGQLVVVRE